MSDSNMQGEQGDQGDQDQEGQDNIATQYASSYDRRQALPEQRPDETEQDYRRRLARNERSRIYNKARNAKKRQALGQLKAEQQAQAEQHQDHFGSQTASIDRDEGYQSPDNDSIHSDQDIASSPPTMPSMHLDTASNLDSDTPKVSGKAKSRTVNGDKRTGGKKSARTLQAEEGMLRSFLFLRFV